jgi:hypothetical protein
MHFSDCLKMCNAGLELDKNESELKELRAKSLKELEKFEKNKLKELEQ